MEYEREYLVLDGAGEREEERREEVCRHSQHERPGVTVPLTSQSKRSPGICGALHGHRRRSPDTFHCVEVASSHLFRNGGGRDFHITAIR